MSSQYKNIITASDFWHWNRTEFAGFFELYLNYYRVNVITFSTEEKGLKGPLHPLSLVCSSN